MVLALATVVFSGALTPGVASAAPARPGAGTETTTGTTTGAAPAPGTVVRRTFTDQAGSRDYDLYVPRRGGAGAPLLIWLHGCNAPTPAVAGQGLAKIAEEKGFSIAMPFQTATANPQRCWNWFVPSQIQRGAGEAAILAGLTSSLSGELGSDSARTYVAGYSAGGAMTSVLAATYPDLYAAAAPSSGAPYLADPTGRAAYRAMGPRARPVPVFIVQGLTDELSVYPIGRTNLSQWLGTDDLADDGAANGSIPQLPTSVSRSTIATPSPVEATIERYATRGCTMAEFFTTPLSHLPNGALLSGVADLDFPHRMVDFLLAHRGTTAGRTCG